LKRIYALIGDLPKTDGKIWSNIFWLFDFLSFIVLCDKIDFLLYAGDVDTSDHAAQVAEGRRGKQKVNEGRSMMS
jgi:hypothetical protein